jgi:hypothetical protein
MVPSSVGSVPVKRLLNNPLHSHHTAALSPQPGDGAHVQARWVRAMHAQLGHRSQRAQLSGKRPREKSPGVRVQAPVPPHAIATLSSQPGDVRTRG